MHEVDGKEITVRELKVKELVWIYKQVEKGLDLKTMKKAGQQFIDKAFPGMKLEEVYEMAPSDIEEVWEVFRELNAPFFKAAKAFGLEGMLKALQNQLQLNYWKAVSESARKVSEAT